jgi:hypothetical protein
MWLMHRCTDFYPGETAAPMPRGTERSGTERQNEQMRTNGCGTIMN